METDKSPFKIIIAGDANTGKTSIVKRFIEESFFQRYEATIGVEFTSKSVFIGNRNIRLQVWDISGQDRFRAIGAGYFRGCDGCILVFDATNQNSFEKLHIWLNLIEQNAPTDMIVLLVANKIDKKDDIFYQSIESIKKTNVASRVHEIHEISAKSGYKVYDIFRNLAIIMMKKRVEILRSKGDQVFVTDNVVRLVDYSDLKSKETCSC